jgi:phage repressor protein C with HTH and peptisase S24 domain
MRICQSEINANAKVFFVSSLMSKTTTNEICSRIAGIRMEFVGPRGKSSFAKQLGISPSTYDSYESSRTPPADVLVKIADLAGVDLRWLLTGDEPGPENTSQVPTSHPAVRRAAELLSHHGEAARPLAAFLDILAATMRFPQKPGEPAKPAGVVSTASPETPVPRTGPCQPAGSDLIPVLGRSAAGIPCFWASQTDAAGMTTLGELVERHLENLPSQAMRLPAVQSSPEDSCPDPTQPVQLIRLPEPVGESGPTEYIQASAVKEQYPDAFAVWIDGDSMSPEIRHGDLVLLSPSAQAQAGRSAVIQLAGAIGVTCKLYHPAGDMVHLVPINEQFPPTTARAEQVQWSLRVLARIRMGGR